MMQQILVCSISIFVQVFPLVALQQAAAEQKEKPTPMHPYLEGVDPTVEQTLDGATFDAVLRAHVRHGRIDFETLRRDSAARALLDEFLRDAATMPESEPLASWINVYNALVIDFVLDRYPLRSVMEVPDFFSALKRPVAGKERSLDDVENNVIRPRFKDARVHFALNCGAMSCPPLPAEAFVQPRLDAQLDAVAAAGVNDPRHVSMVDGQLRLSELFFWFAEDFEREAGSVEAWLSRYAAPGTLDGLSEKTPLVREEYDWALGSAAVPE